MVSDLIKRSGMVARIGLAAHRLKMSRTEDTRQKARRALAALFADARGVTMKFGQLMAGVEDDDPLQNLVTSVEPLPLSDMIPVIEQELGRPFTEIFESIEESSAAASLGQVHQARLKDGSTVAVKVQYPSIKDAVDAEMKLFGLMPGVGPVSKWGFDLGGYKSSFKANMDRELDYRDEARRQENYYTLVKVPGLVVPRVFTKFSTRRMLVQEWQDGVTLSVAATWPVDERGRIGEILLATLFRSLFDAGEVHGDPHAGNYMFRKSPDGDIAVVLMDFGCTVPVAREKRLALLKMIIALREEKPYAPLEAFAAIGFDADKLCSISATLMALSHILLEPFMTAGRFFVGHWRLKKRFEALLGENRWWFRAAGAPSNILLLRAFQGFVQQQDTLKCGLDWWSVLNEILPRALLDEARAYEFPKLSTEISQHADYAASQKSVAKSLRIRVREGTKEIVSLSMPPEAALRLQELIPEDVMKYLQASLEWDVDAIVAGVRARGIEPQEILSFDKDVKSYRIWLE